MLTDSQLADAERGCKAGHIEAPLLALRPRIGADMSEALLNVVQECMRLRAANARLTEQRDACWSRLDNWDWRGLQRDARRGDYTSVADALRDVVAMEESRESAMSDEMENSK